MRHEPLLAKNVRMALQVKNVARMTDSQKQAVRLRADAIRSGEVEASHASAQDLHAH
jgi:deoxyribodipyrimidine photolyase-related protein